MATKLVIEIDIATKAQFSVEVALLMLQKWWGLHRGDSWPGHPKPMVQYNGEVFGTIALLTEKEG